MLSKSPASKALDKTPKQAKPVPQIQSEQKQNSKKNNKKRKSLPANLINGSNDISPKKPKLEPFTGTSDLFMQLKKNPQNEGLDTNKEDKPSKKLKTDAAPAQTSKKQLKNKNRAASAQARRVAAKEKLKKTIKDASLGDVEAITFIKTRIAEFEKHEKLTSSSKRKLRLLRRVLKSNADTDTKLIQSSSKVTKTIKEKNIKKEKNQKPEVTKMAIKTEDVSEDDSDSIDENVIKKESNIKNKKLQILKSQVKNEEDSDDDNEEESEEAEEDESENNESNLSESMEEDEEKDEDEEEDEDDEEDEDEDDSSNEDAKEEESDSDEEMNTSIQVPKKKEQTKPFQKQDTEKIDSPTGNKSQFTLFVGNIPFDVTQEEIAEHFSIAGNIKDIRIPVDKNTNKCRGFAYVELLNKTSYQKALTLHHTTLKGRTINVMDSEKGKNVQSRPMRGGGRPFANRGGHRGGQRGGQRGGHRGGQRGGQRGNSRFRGNTRY